MHEPACILLNKPSGLTSFQFLGPVKKKLGEKRIGHTGTLDKFAEGLMIVLVGQATRLARYFEFCNKHYRAEVLFGLETDTLDPEGRVIAEADTPSEQALRSALGAFRGSIEQYPPQFSAVHVQGKRAYQLARSGEAPAMKARTVRIHCLELLGFETDVYANSAQAHCGGTEGAIGGGSAGAAGTIDEGSAGAAGAARRSALAVLDVHCSKGTYIRSLARDLARSLGSRAHLRALKRTAIESATAASATGEFGLAPKLAGESGFLAGTAPSAPTWYSENALYLKEFLALDEKALRSYTLRGADLLGMIPGLRILRVGADLAKSLRLGRELSASDLPTPTFANTSADSNSAKKSNPPPDSNSTENSNTSAQSNTADHTSTPQKLLGILDPNNRITAILELHPETDRLQYHSVFPLP